MTQVYYPPLCPGNYTSLRIDMPTPGVIDPILEVYEDIFKRDFYSNTHRNFIGSEEGGDHFIISVLVEPIRVDTFRSLITYKKDYKELELNVPLGDENSSLTDRIENALRLNTEIVPRDSLFYPVFSGGFPDDLLKVEEKHSQKKTKMKIGVIYCRKGQVTPLEMFKNGTDGNEPCSEAFWNFIRLLGEKITIDENWTKYTGDMSKGNSTYYTVWRNIEVIYHIAPLLNKEAHRRLIGNDIAVLFFLEAGDDAKFDPSQVSLLGTVPQIFSVVQPVGDKFRLAFFSNINIKKFPPDVPKDLVDPITAKDLILAKFHNGLVKVNYCPPMNRLFYVPRKETIEAMVAR